jgi:ribonuclease HII
MLNSNYGSGLREAGCDEAGRGCLAGPVYAAAVILPPDYQNNRLNDSKKLSEKERYRLREIIIKDAIAWSVSSVDNQVIDRINILNASYEAMHQSIRMLRVIPEFLLIDGNRFKTYPGIPHECIIKGDGLYLSIAAASILAKTFRDDLMNELAVKFPMYGWTKNKGYPTRAHRKAILEHGLTPFHRKSYSMQLNIW